MSRKNLRDNLQNILEADEEQIEKIRNDFLRNQAREIRRMAEVET